MTAKFITPIPRPAIAAPDLVRPDWTGGELRDPDMLWLDKNENTDPELAKVVADVIAGLPEDAHNTYPESGPLYRKLANWLGLAPENLLLASGSDGCIRSVFEAFMSPGDTVVHSAPTFAMYFVCSKIYGLNEVCVDYLPSKTGPALDAGRFIAAIADNNPKLVCLPNPDSPTGTVMPSDDLRAIIEAAGEAGAVMLVDEAYHPFLSDTVLPWVNDYLHLVVTRSTGKAWGMAGVRIGYAAANPDLVRQLHKVRPMYETSTLAVCVFDRMLDQVAEMEASVRRLETGKEHFLNAMEGLSLRTLRGAGNFCHVEFGDDAGAVHGALADLVYYRQNFNDPGLAGFSRFSATTKELFQPVIDRIRTVIVKET